MQLMPLDRYDMIIVSYSGGKDSLACILRLLKMGVPKERLQLWHQCVDGEPGVDRFMDWPITEGYVRTTGKAFGIQTRFQWKEGGFRGEMCRNEALTRPVRFEAQDGRLMQAGGVRGKKTTRELFPQVSGDLSVRWCSPYLKIDVAALALNNDPALRYGTYLFVTGERRQEGSVGKDGQPRGRAAYEEIEPHRCDNKRRRVDTWRAVIDFSEQQVWDLIREFRVAPHPAYYCGFGRVSCLT